MPDVLFAIGMALLVMSMVFAVASFMDDALSNGDAGTQLARIFAGTLFLSATFSFLLGLLLLRGERNRADHFVVPLVAGALMGGLEAAMFLNPKTPLLLLLPLVLLVFAFRPVRGVIARLFGGGRPRARR